MTALPGERRLAGLLDHEARAGDDARVVLAHAERVPGIGVVAVGDHDRRHADLGEVVQRVEGPRTRDDT
jgi:hypothetical protein